MWFLVDFNAFLADNYRLIESKCTKKESDHGFNVIVDFFSSVAPVTIFTHWLSQSWHQQSFWGGQLEWINELLDLVELLSDIHHLIDNVFKTQNLASDLLFNQFVWLDLNSLIIDFSVGFLVEKLAYNFLRWLAPCDIVFNSLECGKQLLSDLL